MNGPLPLFNDETTTIFYQLKQSIFSFTDKRHWKTILSRYRIGNHAKERRVDPAFGIQWSEWATIGLDDNMPIWLTNTIQTQVLTPQPATQGITSTRMNYNEDTSPGLKQGQLIIAWCHVQTYPYKAQINVHARDRTSAPSDHVNGCSRAGILSGFYFTVLCVSMSVITPLGPQVASANLLWQSGHGVLPYGHYTHGMHSS